MKILGTGWGVAWRRQRSAIGRPFPENEAGHPLQLPAAHACPAATDPCPLEGCTNHTVRLAGVPLPAVESHLLSCMNTGESSWAPERGRREVPLSRSNHQSQWDRKSLTATKAKQEVPPQSPAQKRATRPAHTCVAVRTVLGSPLWRHAGGLEERRGTGNNHKSYPGCDMTHPFPALARTIPKLAEFNICKGEKGLVTLGRNKCMQ